LNVLTIDVAEQKDVLIMVFKGDLIFNELDEADKLFMENLAKKPRAIGLDCKRLVSLDSSGLGLFIRFSKESVKAGVRLVFMNITDHVSTLFDVSKLDSMFEILPEAEFKKQYPA
jgi:anti-sigma B factor antagonist